MTMTALSQLEAIIRSACPETMEKTSTESGQQVYFGSPLTLEHVLRAIHESGDLMLIDSVGEFRLRTDEATNVFYDLTKNLADQSPQVHEFLLNLLK